MKNLTLAVLFLLGVVTTFSQDFLDKTKQDVFNTEFNFQAINDSVLVNIGEEIHIKLLFKGNTVVAEHYIILTQQTFKIFTEFIDENYNFIEEEEGLDFYFKHKVVDLYCVARNNTFTFTKGQ